MYALKILHLSIFSATRCTDVSFHSLNEYHAYKNFHRSLSTQYTLSRKDAFADVEFAYYSDNGVAHTITFQNISGQFSIYLYMCIRMYVVYILIG